MKIDIIVTPEKEVYYPGDIIRAIFKVKGLMKERVESIEIGFIGKEVLEFDVLAGKSRLIDKRENLILNYKYSYIPQQLNELSRQYEFIIPESAPPSLNLKDKRTSSASSINISYKLYVKVKRRMGLDYHHSKEINIGLKPLFKVNEVDRTVLSTHGENIDFYAELDRGVVSPGEEVKLFLKARKLYGVRKVKVKIEGHAWALCKRYGINITSCSSLLLEMRSSEISPYGRTFKLLLPKELPPTYKSEHWWSWSEIVIEFRGLLKKVLELRKEILVNYRYIKPKKVEYYIICPWCCRNIPKESESCPFCNFKLKKT